MERFEPFYAAQVDWVARGTLGRSGSVERDRQV